MTQKEKPKTRRLSRDEQEVASVTQVWYVLQFAQRGSNRWITLTGKGFANLGRYNFLRTAQAKLRDPDILRYWINEGYKMRVVRRTLITEPVEESVTGGEYYDG